MTWWCDCECGKGNFITSADLKSGRVNSCGCIKDLRVKMMNWKHGATEGRRKNFSEYNIWCGIKRRCTSLTSDDYPDYGGRGIKMHMEWQKDFMLFLKDMGMRPSKKHSIDRIDVNGNYEPSNCRWATIYQQANNKRTSRKYILNGKQYSSGELGYIYGIDRRKFEGRIKRGWTVERALNINVP